KPTYAKRLRVELVEIDPAGRGWVKYIAGMICYFQKADAGKIEKLGYCIVAVTTRLPLCRLSPLVDCLFQLNRLKRYFNTPLLTVRFVCLLWPLAYKQRFRVDGGGIERFRVDCAAARIHEINQTVASPFDAFPCRVVSRIALASEGIGLISAHGD